MVANFSIQCWFSYTRRTQCSTNAMLQKLSQRRKAQKRMSLTLLCFSRYWVATISFPTEKKTGMKALFPYLIESRFFEILFLFRSVFHSFIFLIEFQSASQPGARFLSFLFHCHGWHRYAHTLTRRHTSADTTRDFHRWLPGGRKSFNGLKFHFYSRCNDNLMEREASETKGLTGNEGG